MWHGLLLVLVLLSFGSAAFWLARENQFKNIDVELQRRMNAVASSILPRPRIGMGGPGNRMGPDGSRLPMEFRLNLSEEQKALFSEGLSGSPYYVVRLPGDEDAYSSSNAPPEVPLPDPETLSRDPELRVRGEYRELAGLSIREGAIGLRMNQLHRGTIVVGYSLTETKADLRRFAFLLAGIGFGVLGIGLMIGWHLSGRAIKPIRGISSTARTIAEGHLTERINLAETESELGELAQLLNTTFDRLHAASVRQAEFTADASHELRTPAFVVLSQAQTALRKERSVEEYQEGFRVCRKAAEQMRQLIESLLILARNDADADELCREICSLDDVVNGAVELLRSMASEKNMSIQLDLSEVPVSGDERQLHQVVANLLNNAIEYGRSGGVIQVKLEQTDDHAVLWVADDGPGVSDEDLPHIFERFYRADKSRSSEHGHTGLGLPICKAIVEAHGGSIEVSSRSGKGAVFVVRLPACVLEVD
ncbi:MAG: HAMP domain-containing sensor histidine kinase [Verrucomicrobiota bacterium]